MTPDRRGDGVVVPPGLCRQLARLAVLGLREQVRRDGGVAPAAGLAALLAALDSSGAGTPPANLVSLAPFTVREAAQVCGVTPRMVRRLAASGRLIARRAGPVWLIDRQSIADYGRERRNAA